MLHCAHRPFSCFLEYHLFFTASTHVILRNNLKIIRSVILRLLPKYEYIILCGKNVATLIPACECVLTLTEQREVMSIASENVN